MEAFKIKKQPSTQNSAELLSLTKEELVEKIKALEAHNSQLKNIIIKQDLNNKKQLTQRGNKFDFSKCPFRRVLLKFYYLGWDYNGYVKQEDTTNTIEHYLFEALLKTCLIKDRESSNYHRCGRTDKGVSSFGQVISIDLRSNLKEGAEQNDLHKEIEYCKVLNKVLPDNIQCICWAPIDANFSARFDCKSRMYKYYFPQDNLDVKRMEEGAAYLTGTHDFRNLCKMDVGNGVVKFIRNISSVDIKPVTNEEDEYTILVLTIKGQSFLWHQIRCIVAILFLIGQNKESPNIVQELLDVENNPRKPDYNIASEIPLNLYSCEYDVDNWYIDQNALAALINKLKSTWLFSAIKTTMIKSMLDDLTKLSDGSSQSDSCMVDKLMQGAKTKKYVPLMKRQKCESLENRIEHYVKRSRLEVVEK